MWTIPAGGGRSRNLTPDIDNSCYNATISDVADANFDAEPPMWSPCMGRVYFSVSEYGSCNLYEVSTRGRKVKPRVVGEHVISGLSRTAGKGRAVFVRPRLSETCNGGVNQTGIDLLEFFVSQPKPIHNSLPEVFHKYV